MNNLDHAEVAHARCHRTARTARVAGRITGVEAAVRHRKKRIEARYVPVVLLVEDEPDIRGLTAHQLTRSGFEVLTAGDAASAILTCRVHPGSIDVLLTDLGLPGVSGGELARAATAIRPAMNVVYLSGVPEQIALDHGLIPPGATFIAKPYTLDNLTTTLRAVTSPQSAGSLR